MKDKNRFYEFTKEILSDNEGIEIDFDDKNLKIIIHLNLSYSKILTEKNGKFENNEWEFNYKLKKHSKYLFVIDINNLLNFVRPFQFELIDVPFKLPVLTQTFQITGIDGNVKGFIEVELDTTDNSIILKSNVLSPNDEISIYELNTELFK